MRADGHAWAGHRRRRHAAAHRRAGHPAAGRAWPPRPGRFWLVEVIADRAVPSDNEPVYGNLCGDPCSGRFDPALARRRGAGAGQRAGHAAGAGLGGRGEPGPQLARLGLLRAGAAGRTALADPGPVGRGGLDPGAALVRRAAGGRSRRAGRAGRQRRSARGAVPGRGGLAARRLDRPAGSGPDRAAGGLGVAARPAAVAGVHRAGAAVPGPAGRTAAGRAAGRGRPRRRGGLLRDRAAGDSALPPGGAATLGQVAAAAHQAADRRDRCSATASASCHRPASCRSRPARRRWPTRSRRSSDRNVTLRLHHNSADAAVRAVTEAQHLDRIPLDRPAAKPTVDVWVPDTAADLPAAFTPSYGWIAFARDRSRAGGGGPAGHRTGRGLPGPRRRRRDLPATCSPGSSAVTRCPRPSGWPRCEYPQCGVGGAEPGGAWCIELGSQAARAARRSPASACSG